MFILSSVPENSSSHHWNSMITMLYTICSIERESTNLVSIRATLFIQVSRDFIFFFFFIFFQMFFHMMRIDWKHTWELSIQAKEYRVALFTFEYVICGKFMINYSFHTGNSSFNIKINHSSSKIRRGKQKQANRKRENVTYANRENDVQLKHKLKIYKLNGRKDVRTQSSY